MTSYSFIFPPLGSVHKYFGGGGGGVDKLVLWTSIFFKPPLFRVLIFFLSLFRVLIFFFDSPQKITIIAVEARSVKIVKFNKCA